MEKKAKNYAKMWTVWNITWLELSSVFLEFSHFFSIFWHVFRPRGVQGFSATNPKPRKPFAENLLYAKP